MWGYHDGMGWWMVFGGVWMLVFWVIIIGLVAWGVNGITGVRRGRQDVEETPMEIARRRLAQGEITKEQFEDIKSALQ